MADGKRPQLSAEERTERGSRESRRLRRAGMVPGVVYGGGETTSFKVGARDLRNVLHDGAALMDLSIGGAKARPVILKDRHVHPVRDEFIHVDFLEVRLDEKIHTTVAVELEGVEEAPGVKDGGVLEHVSRELNIEALPTDIPERIVVDVSGMEINATMHLSEISVPGDVVLLDDPEETIIATITPPSKVEEPESEVEEEAALVGEGEDGEGAAPADGDADASADASGDSEE
ncbi:MAG TPA: 50S ribosomal protein L25 [Thermoleophilaceae bacterium]|nr:50S ribosomal protein L25 [Thermoleophilaceae bacterium]